MKLPFDQQKRVDTLLEQTDQEAALTLAYQWVKTRCLSKAAFLDVIPQIMHKIPVRPKGRQ